MKQSISEKIIRNTIFNAIGRFWGIAVALFLTPYIIGHIGIERYGIWALVGVLTGYFGLLDFGIGTSFVKYISEFYATKDYKKINQVVNTGFVFYLVFAAIIISVGFFVINPLLSLLKIPPNLYDEARFVFLLGIIIFGVSNALSSFGAIQGGLQRMDISNKVAIVISIPMIIGTIFFLEKGYGLKGLMVNNAIIFMVGSVVNLIIAFKVLPELRFAPLLFFSKKMFKKLFGFGCKLQITAIANLLHFQTDKIILAYFLNVGFVSYYTIAQNLVYKARGIPLMLVSAIMPAASELEAETNKESLYKLYFRSMKYIVLIGLPISILTILLARPFIDLWLGKGFERSVLTVQIFMFSYFFNIITAPGFFILHGMGKPQYGMRSSVIAALLNLVLSVLLVIKIGYFGAVIGTAISMVIAAGYFIIKFHKFMFIPILETAMPVFLKPLVACAASAMVVYILEPRAGFLNWYLLIGFGCMYMAVFVAAIISLKHFDDFDKVLVNNCLLKAKRRFGNGDREAIP
ncbi:MAG: oligosaccharide flippase family protein [Elusimicrobia bacterium]|nr:oligosaccharide flippase family protein [Elusimicrobiota bacterium]